MNKEQAINIFKQIAEQISAKPAEHALIQQAIKYLETLEEKKEA